MIVLYFSEYFFGYDSVYFFMQLYLDRKGVNNMVNLRVNYTDLEFQFQRKCSKFHSSDIITLSFLEILIYITLGPYFVNNLLVM